VLEQVLAADILVLASPTWLGKPSSVTQRALERLDALIDLEDEAGREWSHTTGRAAASNLVAAARALRAQPIPAPPSE
jgi:multimeric flavodoxin WrbA